MDSEIRRLTIDDYDDIIRVWADAGLEYRPKGRDSRPMVAKEMQFPGAAYFGYYENGRMIGAVIANYDGRRGWINRLAVDPDCRGRGIAGLLIKEGERFLRSVGAIVMTALIHELNTPSMSCFEKEGYHCQTDFEYFSKKRSEED
ncbi:MAG: GNAT family N-acetyltransferase [candidate division Zixibacteria bacterium]|nr:GNAT family N-acetyltransferase [candidate division Zixibacteria bacterium]